MNNRIQNLFLFLMFLTGISRSQVSTCTAIANGDWLTPGIWSCGQTPTCGMLVIIPAGRTVSITSQVDLTNCSPVTCSANCTGTCAAKGIDMYVAGYLKFTNGNKLRLPCCSEIVSAPGATIQPGTGGGSSNFIEICTNKVWTADSGNVIGTNCFPKPCSPLPVEFIGFTGNLEVKVVFLKWKTATETNNDYFDVEKSADGVNFYKIGQLRSKGIDGNSATMLNYDFVDSDLKHPLYYYRLRQVDRNGKSDYSNVISVKIYSPELSIFPNPNNGTFWIDVPTAKVNQKIDVQIYDQLSNSILNQEYTVVNDNITGARVNITPSKPFAKGVYLTRINFEGTIYKLKLVVQ